MADSRSPLIWKKMSQEKGHRYLEELNRDGFLIRESTQRGMITVDYQYMVGHESLQDSIRLSLQPTTTGKLRWEITYGSEVKQYSKTMTAMNADTVDITSLKPAIERALIDADFPEQTGDLFSLIYPPQTLEDASAAYLGYTHDTVRLPLRSTHRDTLATQHTNSTAAAPYSGSLSSRHATQTAQHTHSTAATPYPGSLSSHHAALTTQHTHSTAATPYPGSLSSRHATLTAQHTHSSAAAPYSSRSVSSHVPAAQHAGASTITPGPIEKKPIAPSLSSSNHSYPQETARSSSSTHNVRQKLQSSSSSTLTCRDRDTMDDMSMMMDRVIIGSRRNRTHAVDDACDITYVADDAWDIDFKLCEVSSSDNESDNEADPNPHHQSSSRALR